MPKKSEPEKNPTANQSASNADDFSLARQYKKQAPVKPVNIETIDNTSYLESKGMNLKKDLTITKALDEFNTNRITNAEEFKEPKIKDTPLGEVLKKASTSTDQKSLALQDISTKINGVFATSEDSPFTKASSDFNKIVNHINKQAKEKPSVIDILAFANTLEKERHNLLSSMDKQFKQENEALQTLIENIEFKQSVMTNFELNDEGYRKFTDEMKENLKKEQNLQKQNFEKAFKNQVSALYFDAQLRLELIADIGEKVKNSKFKAHVKQAYGQDRLDAIERDKSLEAIMSIKLEGQASAGVLTALSGRKITYNKSTDSFEYKFPGKWNLKYNFSLENKAANDMRSIAEAVKKCGHTSITTTLSHSDPKNAEELGRMAYEACRMAGFPEDKIKIKINTTDPKTGKLAERTMDAKELFTNHSEWHESIETNALQVEKQRLSGQKAMPSDKLALIKQKSSELRSKALKEAPTPQSSPQPHH
jgi:hypothetical protein